ncbi:MAG: TPM domain-containing protein [Vitreoscilla sp.]|nr:TPM domain-containing protein [Burkholderiales bacterium]MBP6336957.1 TPM domain-containing protein [Vitreoscilla sp.]MBP6675131.1 TPM domain-containing protein [Vitreoscilla sp.]
MHNSNRFIRILKHRWLDERDAQRAFRADGLARIQALVKASEHTHTGEIRVCVEAGLPLSYLWRRALPRERAVALFGKLGVWNTEANNGVLIYLLLAEHAIEIVADRGLSARVPQARWHELLDGMRTEFRAGHFEAGLARAIGAVGDELRRHFPLAAGSADLNELPDTPDLR